MDGFLTLSLLILLVALSFYAGYRCRVESMVEDIVDHVFNELQKDGVIRIVEGADGENEIYSGNKHP